MKSSVRLLTVFLVMLLVFSAVACDSGNAETNETNDQQSETKPIDENESKDEDSGGTVNGGSSETVAATEVEVLPDVEKNNYGADFFLSVLPDVNPFEIYWVEDGEGDVMTEATFKRLQDVYEYLGVEVIGSMTLGYNAYITPFKTAVKNKDGSVHTLISHVDTGVSGLISESFIRNFDEMPGIDLDREYWNYDFMDSLSIAGDHYLGYSDMNVLFTHAITYNKEMLDKYDDTMEMNVYDMVRQYKWTLDEMISLVNLVYIDATSDGKTTDDTFGLVGMQWVPWVGFMQASNINLIEADESGQYKVSIMNEVNKYKTSDLVAKLSELAKSDSVYVDYMKTTATISITSGKALMELTPTIAISQYLNYDVVFGILPYPMYDEAQKDVGYRHLQWGGYLCIPSYLYDDVMTGETLEVMSYFSEGVKVAYYEKLLGKQVADMPDDRAMLDLIWDTVCTDIGQTFSEICSYSLLYMLPHVTAPGTTEELASFVRANENNANKALDKFIKKMEKLKG